jgi:toxin ParE1/3/4
VTKHEGHEAKVRLEITQSAATDLESVADFIAEDSPERADRVILAIERKMALIASHPQLYQLRPEIGENIRLAVVHPYVILYRITGEVVRIERIVYGGRDLPSLLE